MKDESICRQITKANNFMKQWQLFGATTRSVYSAKVSQLTISIQLYLYLLLTTFSFPFTNRIKKRIIYHLARARWGADFHVQWLGAGMREQMKLKNNPNGRLRNRWLSGYWQWIFALRITEKNFKLRNNSVNIFIDDNLLMG